jgi:hypothetical protein
MVELATPPLGEVSLRSPSLRSRAARWMLLPITQAVFRTRPIPGAHAPVEPLSLLHAITPDEARAGGVVCPRPYFAPGLHSSVCRLLEREIHAAVFLSPQLSVGTVWERTYIFIAVLRQNLRQKNLISVSYLL